MRMKGKVCLDSPEVRTWGGKGKYLTAGRIEIP